MDAVRPRRILIVEGNPDGHRLYYASLLASAAEQAGEQVSIATRELAISSLNGLSTWRLWPVK
ncbi:hypothetical protein AHiyo6_01340 [Arthrobacter sp. Hiyo6]|nr:hypothetical protein AHiyo6_01340 [Arthrobacter sp. Hiyo6]